MATKRSKEKQVGKLSEYTFVFPQKPEPKTWKQIIYDERDGKFFGRTRQSWWYLFLFYGIYFIVLFSMFWACMEGLFYTLNDNYPKYQLEESLIGVNPGLGYRPLPDDVRKAGFVHFKQHNKTEMDYWITRLDTFLEPYRNLSSGADQNLVKCNFGEKRPTGKSCIFDVNNLGPCSPSNRYGYNESQPCIFLKLNRIYGWIPEYFDDVNDLPENMPSDLVEYIKSIPEVERKQIWVSCNGVYPGDREATGPFAFYPSHGIASYYYPYTNTKGYLGPLVAVQFVAPKRKQNIFVECRAWAKNIAYHGGSRLRMGSVLFSLLID
ncbi:sodium/potassium-transporting ATPase subunit beta-1-like [Topomyia yanbarensis]|uniref:sodium/potassium-transporting ATPase subunit beta-1-like n=1 Tax=Topomyia yanbarensis TaxID=2498891 RepID=UPI00273C5F03|nr:sodium/potassium-transporting ATPase subunit beta-1-like [Topomyia yanbarensis]